MNIKENKKDTKVEDAKRQEHLPEKESKNESKPDITPNDSKDVQIEELTNTLKRLAAEFDNFKKRTEKENAAYIKNAHSSIVKELLPVLDSFELALKNDNCDNPEIEKYRKGLELIYSQLYSILEDYGLKAIETKGQKFDPYRHEVLMVKESSEPEDTIIQEFQKGYMLNENIIRHSKVMISKKENKEN